MECRSNEGETSGRKRISVFLWVFEFEVDDTLFHAKAPSSRKVTLFHAKAPSSRNDRNGAEVTGNFVV